MEGSDDENIRSKIKIFSTTDARLKHLGEMLSNDSSRSMLALLVEGEFALGELSKKTGLSLSLVTYHINKMIDADIVMISRVTRSVKGHDVKYYRAKLGIIILGHGGSERAMHSKTFYNSLKRIFKFASIGVAALVPWVVATSKVEDGWQSAEDPPALVSDDVMLTAAITLGVIVVGVIMERVYTHYKKQH